MINSKTVFLFSGVFTLPGVVIGVKRVEWDTQRSKKARKKGGADEELCPLRNRPPLLKGTNGPRPESAHKYTLTSTRLLPSSV